ncbi:hypothetical protein [Oricola thermophila]|uniref:Uncharacterized protein n=1 Tax=Oricola thermophila TaxID=2742145 RepID=A0A6N1VHI9_9HYPH|nr:hypothetical protein [Oricola thermophila]QKV20258.1 hypothetical protein HTY61_18265 [Oricola thermophila]
MKIVKTPELIDLAAGELFSAWAAGAGLNCTWQQARDMTAAAPENYPRLVNAVASARHRASVLLDAILPVIGDRLRRQPRGGPA